MKDHFKLLIQYFKGVDKEETWIGKKMNRAEAALTISEYGCKLYLMACKYLTPMPGLVSIPYLVRSFS